MEIKCKNHPTETLEIKEDNLFRIDQAKIDSEGHIVNADKALAINVYICPVCGYCELYKYDQ